MESIITRVGGAWLTRFDGRRYAHSEHPIDELRGRDVNEKIQADANVMEEIECDTNNAGQCRDFGGENKMIWDSGAGRNICARKHVPDYSLSKSDHPGFTGPSGENIKVDGRARVSFSDETLGTTAEADFIVANRVTRPILSGDDHNNQDNITISSAKCAFVVDESLARATCEALMPHAKLAFSRAGPGRLYVHTSQLLPQPATFFRGQE